jgi:hypothetical protein
MNRKNMLKKLPSCLLGALFVAGVASTAMVYAVDGTPPGLFELEGNTTDDAAVGTDWDALYGGATPANMITFTGILPDPAPESIFWKGGSKDISDVPNWWQKSGGVPDKDDITNAYAAAYTNPADICINAAGAAVACTETHVGDPLHKADDLIVYFGLDRYANTGDAFAGFWFFQDDVAISGQQFSGQHVPRSADGPGDILVLVEYPQASGSHPTVKVYEWDPADLDNDNVADNLDLLITQTNAECDGTGGKLACAISNTSDLSGQPAWPYTPKSGTGLPFESFFEGGINVTQLLGTTPCFSAFLAETRSSRSETAVLKDFAIGNFDVCGASVSKNCEATINPVGDQVQVDFTGNSRNIGGLPLYMELQDDQVGSVITAVCFDDGDGICGTGTDTVPSDLNSLPANIASFTLSAGQQVLYEGNYLVTTFNDQTEFTDEVTLSFFDDPAGAALGSVTDTATCPPQGNAAIDVTKACNNPRVENGTTFVADITGTVQNTGNVKLVNVNLSDTVFNAAQLTVVRDSNGDGLVTAGEPAFANGSDLSAGAKLAFAATVNSTTPSHSNIMTVTGANTFDATDTVSDFASAGCAPDVTPNLTIVKDCDPALGGGSGVRLVAEAGQVVVEVGNIITVTNTGQEVLTNVLISDTQVANLVKQSGGANLTCTAASSGVDAKCTGTLGLGETVVFKQQYKPDGSAITGVLGLPDSVAFNNVASAQGTGILSATPVGPLTDDASCELCAP